MLSLFRAVRVLIIAALVKLVSLPKFIVALVKPVSVSSLLSSLPKLEGFPVCIMGCAVLFRTELLRRQTAQKDFTEPEPPILQNCTASTSATYAKDTKKAKSLQQETQTQAQLP